MMNETRFKVEGSKNESTCNSQVGISDMVAYEIYWHDPVKGYELIGVLPERRKNPERITEGSIINWARKFFGKYLDMNGIFVLQLKTDQNTGNTSRHTPFFITLTPRIVK